VAKAVEKAKKVPQSAVSERFSPLVPKKCRFGTSFAPSAHKVDFVHIWHYRTEQKKADSFSQLSAFAVTKS